MAGKVGEPCQTTGPIPGQFKIKIELHVKRNVNVNDICLLLGCYAAYTGSYQRFGTTCGVQSSKVKQSKKNASNTSPFQDLHAPVTLLASTTFSENQPPCALFPI